MSYIPNFATEVTNIARNKTVYVETINAFPDPVAGVITLEANTTYTFTNSVNTGTIEFIIPDDGNITLNTTNTVANNLISEITGSQVLFTGNIGRLAIQGLDLVSSSGGQCFDLTAGAPIAVPNLFMTELRIVGFDVIGTIDGIGFFIENIAFIDNDDGITLNNVAAITTQELNFQTQGGDFITMTGTNFFALFGSIFGFPGSGNSVYNISSSVTSTLGIQMLGGFFFGVAGGTWFDAAGLDQTSPLVDLRQIRFVQDSYDVGVMEFTDNATETVIVTIDTYVDIAGTIVASAENERFTFASGVLTYIGLESKKFRASVDLTVKKGMGASAQQIRAGFFIDSGSGFVEVKNVPLDMTNARSSVNCKACSVCDENGVVVDPGKNCGPPASNCLCASSAANSKPG